ncbi:hypothetical protein FQR65_LT15498 [Abscondita terminalis]|nr:hypothetical protein FQR65_LT15498 [Abscondita terminalis]
MRTVTEEMFLKGLEVLMDVDRAWIPQGDGFSLYIRPLIFATEEALKAPPVSVLISDFYSRAANGGVGALQKLQEGDLLNRYYDSENAPRPESYLIDIEDQHKASGKEFYRNIRSACESGWDFSSRWFADEKNIQTIEILNLAEVDLNCLLWHLEKTLAKSSEFIGLTDKAVYYKQRSHDRKQNIDRYFWDEETGIYRDYHIEKHNENFSEPYSHIISLISGARK